MLVCRSDRRKRILLAAVVLHLLMLVVCLQLVAGLVSGKLLL
jgi:hypothetical protein